MAPLRKRSKPTNAVVCAHELRDPRWESMADAGAESRIDHYACRACGMNLPREEGLATEGGTAD